MRKESRRRQTGKFIENSGRRRCSANECANFIHLFFSLLILLIGRFELFLAVNFLVLFWRSFFCRVFFFALRRALLSWIRFFLRLVRSFVCSREKLCFFLFRFFADEFSRFHLTYAILFGRRGIYWTEENWFPSFSFIKHRSGWLHCRLNKAFRRRTHKWNSMFSLSFILASAVCRSFPSKTAQNSDVNRVTTLSMSSSSIGKITAK